jgi:hypothetical protein
MNRIERGFLADTSAWIEYLRATGSAVDLALTAALAEPELIAVPGVVVQEVLAGARDEGHAGDLAKLLEGCTAVDPVHPATYHHAAALYRRCRSAGRTVRGTVDCLIAAVALEHGIPVLAADRDLVTLHEICGVLTWAPAPPA